MITVKGTVDNIIFHNKENGYCVFSLLCDQKAPPQSVQGTIFTPAAKLPKELTCVGSIPELAEGEQLELVGEMKTNAKYGEQFIVSGFSFSAPKTREAVIRYLASGILSGVGEVTAKNIYNKFGEKTIEIIENSPQKLAQVSGISAKKAKKIGECFSRASEMREQMIYLQSLSLSVGLSTRIFNVYKTAAAMVIKENPYRLIDDVDGVGFLTADRIAQSAGLAADSHFRIRAALSYALKESSEKNGNTYLLLNDLLTRAENLLSLKFDDGEIEISDILAAAELEGQLRCFQNADGEKCAALAQLYNKEKFIAATLAAIHWRAEPQSLNHTDLLAEFERVRNIKLHENQKKAVLSAVADGACVITGGPGTGKTTIVRAISHILNYQKLKVEYCSPTGRAAKRLSEALGGTDAKTIHRLLGFSFSDGKFNFTYNAANPLEADVVVVDEFSMVDVSVMNSLLRALKMGTRIIMVGDKDQLPSVGAGNVLGDIIKSQIIPVNFLTHIYRQSEGSHIISNAHLINNCKMPILTADSSDFFFVGAEAADVCQTVVGLVSRRLPKFLNCLPSEIQVLSPLRGGSGGVDICNSELQAALNPPAQNKRQTRLGTNIIFREGDRVMQNVNDYSAEWVRTGEHGAIEDGEGVFNGDIGQITSIDYGNVEVTFDDGRCVQYAAETLGNLQLAYALTVHKSQGSEFDAVVIALCGGPPTIINKNLLYTAVTRAKKAVIIVGTKKLLAAAARNNYIARRNTLLCNFLLEENQKCERLYAKV